MSLPSSSRRDWSLTNEGFDQLLFALDADRDAAGRKYELIHRKLMEFFEARGSEAPPDHADDVINRVARRLAEGEQIRDLNAYFYGVARLLWLENLRGRGKGLAPLELAPTPLAENTAEQEVEQKRREDRFRCLENCLENLSSSNRILIVEYYRDEKGVTIEHRKQQAARLNTTVNGLRLRASRIRADLTRCCHACLGSTEDTKLVN
jgi:DNA-directed RNA polymerase specialized sigma24 family protein